MLHMYGHILASSHSTKKSSSGKLYSRSPIIKSRVEVMKLNDDRACNRSFIFQQNKTRPSNIQFLNQSCSAFRYQQQSFFKDMMVHSRPLFVHFQSFQTNNAISTTNQCEKCHVHPVYDVRIQTNNLWNMSLFP